MTYRFQVLRFAEEEGLGTIQAWCREQSIITTYTNIYAGVNSPVNAALMYDGLIFMGGPQSVNDTDAAMRAALDVTESYLKSGKPVLGICLGAQAIAKVSGASITKSEFEFGFKKVRPVLTHSLIAASAELQPDWDVFQWHGENFSIPQGAAQLFTGDVVPNQGFTLGKALGMQFHNELSYEWYEMWRLSLADKHQDERLRMATAHTSMPFERMKALLYGLLNNWKQSW